MNPLWRRYARFFGPNPAEDVRDELRFHLDRKIEDLIAQGHTPAQARREALRGFGNLKEVQSMGEQMIGSLERTRERRGYWEEFRQDLAYALRSLRKEWSFSLITILILSLGLAANTAVFSVVNTVLLRPLPFPDSQSLVWLSPDAEVKPEKRAAAGLSEVTYTIDAYEAYQRSNQSFASLTAYMPFFGAADFILTGRKEPLEVSGVLVAQNFFPTLGIAPRLGRNFTPEEAAKGGQKAVLLSHAFWQNTLGADPAIIGQPLALDNQLYRVAGVLPPDFDFGAVFAPGTHFDVFVPAIQDEMRNWGNVFFAIGRLKPGISITAAQAEANILFPQLRASHRNWWASYASTLTPLKQHVSGKLERSLLLLWSAVGLILLIVCVNLSNLQLARASARSREFSIRSALGAGRARLFRQLLTESLVLSTLGASLGLALAWVLIESISRSGSLALPLLTAIHIDSAALGWTALLTLGVALLFGIVPGIKYATANIQESLRSGGQRSGSGRLQESFRALLVISEVALAAMLLIGAGLLLRSFLNLMDTDLGFQPSRAASLSITYSAKSASERATKLEEILRNVRAIPGIEEAGVVDMLPLGRNRSWGLFPKGRQLAPGESANAIVRVATPGYLPAMGAHFLSGRDFTWRDQPDTPLSIILNQSLAKKYFGDLDPVGRSIFQGNREGTVIGVVANLRVHNLESQGDGEFYVSPAQAGPNGANLVVRTQLPPEQFTAALLETLRRLNPNQPAATLVPLTNLIDRAVSPRRFFALLIGTFATLGLILASLGIYGVISYSVANQTREIGIRMALGATTAQVRFAVVGRSLALALTGAFIGAIAAAGGTRFIASLLYGTQPLDALTFTSTLALLCTVALFAAFLPARRASLIDPQEALRST